MKTVSVSLSPNTEKDDVVLAFKELFSRKKVKGEEIKKLEDNFKKYFNFNYVFSFNSGRSSLIAILKALDIKENDEIIVQAFTCNAAINPITQTKALPVYVDIGKDLNMDPLKIEKKITKNTKAIIVQHTFGVPANISAIKKIAKKHHLFLIEDCAHALGAQYDDEYCGTFGDVSFFSFGRDKVISSVYGGMVATNDLKIKEKLEKIYFEMDFPDKKWVKQQLRHPLIMNIFVLPFYNFLKIGKIILALSIKFKILSKAVSKTEYTGGLPDYFPKRLPNSLAKLANHQFKKLDKLNKHRKKIAKYYQKNLGGSFIEGAIYLKYPILIDNGDEVLKEFNNFNIMLEDGWRKKVIVPPKTDLCKMNYKKGECKNAEKVSKKILILPTHINITEQIAEKIIYILKSLI